MTDLPILQLRLDGLAQGMQDMLFRTAVSPVVREGADASCALFTGTGELLAMSEAIPLLLGGLPGIVTTILKTYSPGSMAPGDIYIMNDPFAGGTHLPDIAIVQPVFAENRIVAFTASLLHHQDIGGARPGSVPPDATEIHHEGLRLPPMRAGANGQLSAEIASLVACASRVPDIVLGDLEAQIAAGHGAAAGIARICADIGAGAFCDAVAACLDLTETRCVQRIKALPAGPFRGEDALDPVPGLGPCAAKVRLGFQNGRLHADFTGSPQQVPAPVNCVRSGPLSAVLYTLITLMGDNTLRNGGLLRCIKLTLPEASVVNAAPPAPVNARTNMVRCITSAVLQAAAQAAPDRMPAANSGMSYVIAFSGAGRTAPPSCRPRSSPEAPAADRAATARQACRPMLAMP